ncbi:MAG TPA: trypco2 family protein [Solirubrobacteraceae bacterium]|jgi:hypothetical protein
MEGNTGLADSHGWFHHRERDGEHDFGLATLLERLKRELTQAATHDRASGGTQLKVKECTVELGLTWTLEGDGDVKFWVLDFTGKATRENAQTIKVTLEPAA